MKRTRILLAFIMLSISSFFAHGATENTAKYIGFKKLTVKPSKAEPGFPIGLIYPTHTRDKAINVGPFKMRLAKGAKIAKGQYPLAIISHGSGSTNLAHRSIAFALVKAGFVVGVPLHPGNNFQNNSAAGSTDSWNDRPAHIKQAIDAVLADKAIGKHINNEQIAVVGYSAGGYTALAAAGGKADTSHLVEYCQQGVIKDPMCKAVKANKVKPQALDDNYDPRIKAIVLMAPVGVLFQAEDALAQVKVPTLLLQAEKDQELTEPYHATVIANNFADKSLLSHCLVKNASHYAFITPFPAEIKDKLGKVAKDPKGFNRSQFHQRLTTDINNYLLDAFHSDSNSSFEPTSCTLL